VDRAGPATLARAGQNGRRPTEVRLAAAAGSLRAINAGQLRPLGVGEVLDVSINLYFRHLGRLLGIAAAIVLPVAALIFLLDVLSLQEVDRFNSNAALYQVGESFRILDESRFVLLQALKTIIYVVGYLLVTGAVFKAVSDAYLGHPPDGRASIGYAAKRLHSLLWISVLLIVGVVIGLIALILPGIYLLVAWSLAVPVLLVEHRKGSKALGRSYELVKNNWWRTFGALLVGIIFIGLFQFLLGLVASGADSVAEDSVYLWALIYDALDALGTIITAPLQAAIITVIYYDLRVRKEGFDVALLSAGLGHPGGPGAAGATAPAGGAPAPSAGSPQGGQLPPPTGPPVTGAPPPSGGSAPPGSAPPPGPGGPPADPPSPNAP
jgi:hypothetical protein